MMRILTALVLTPFIVWVVLLGPDLVFLAVLTAVALLCFHEYSGLIAAYGIPKPGIVGFAAGLILLFLPGDAAVSLFVVFAALLFLGMGIAVADLRQAFLRAATSVFGILYIFGVWRYAALLRVRSAEWIMFALAASWVGDIAAYYVGSRFGRHKMAPTVSPGKSWEGGLASFAASVIFGVLYVKYLIPSAPVFAGALFGAAANVAGQVGDLAESALKRGAGVKDSGSMLPGHGGWLDRVDSSLFAIPVIYFLVRYFG